MLLDHDLGGGGKNMFSYVKLCLLCGGSIDVFAQPKYHLLLLFTIFICVCVWESDIVNIWLIMQISYL